MPAADIDAYIAKAQPFAVPILERVRHVVRAACPDTEEALKWGAPHFVYRGKNLCLTAGFKGHAILGFLHSEMVTGKTAHRMEAMGSVGRLKSIDDLPDEATLTATYKGHAHRFDNPDVGFIKYALQRGLPQKLRNEICTSLFNRYVTSDVHAFADSLYMNEKQIRDLHNHNMFVGGHGWTHMWLDTLSALEQQHEVEMTAGFLRTLAVPTETWVMAYPYGAFNETTRNILSARGWAAGLSTQAGIADLNVHDRFMLPRFDTNDFPIS